MADMPGSRKFCQRGSNSTLTFLGISFIFLLVDEEREDPNTTKSGPLLAYQRNGTYMPADPSLDPHICFIYMCLYFQEKFDGSIEFKSVLFQYPARPDVTVLHDISFTVSPGETVALVGSSGCGKSTTVALLERFYDPASGIVVGANMVQIIRDQARGDQCKIVAIGAEISP